MDKKEKKEIKITGNKVAVIGSLVGTIASIGLIIMSLSGVDISLIYGIILLCVCASGLLANINNLKNSNKK